MKDVSVSESSGWAQMGNFIDKMVTFGVGMGIGEPFCCFSLVQNNEQDARANACHSREWLCRISGANLSECCWYLSAAFYKGWDMTLVILAATPVLAGVGIAIGIVMANLGKKASDAYAKASSIVAENLGNVRTVLAFNGADRAVKAYEGVSDTHFCWHFAVLCNRNHKFWHHYKPFWRSRVGALHNTLNFFPLTPSSSSPVVQAWNICCCNVFTVAALKVTHAGFAEAESLCCCPAPRCIPCWWCFRHF